MTPINLLASLGAKPFLILTGNSGTGKTRLAELLAHWLRGPDGYALIAVGADWTDNRNILGFVNHLRKSKEDTPIYESTPVLNLLLAAVRNPNLPFFLIMDEMNLSHVERYFADFLSAMESKTGKLQLHSIGDSETKLPIGLNDEPIIPQYLKIPDNIFVIGTVNIDETTYMFSPKVLDRSNVIEFRIGKKSLDAFFKLPSHETVEEGQAEESFAKAFLDLSRNARNGTLQSTNKELEIEQAIRKIFSIMEGARLEFGFRTIKEILRYSRVDYELSEIKADWDWKACMDCQILQKILPKLHGSKRRIEPLLIRLAVFCETGEIPVENSVPANLQKNPVALKPAVYAKSYEKLCGMIDTVRRDQFVSFIQ